MLIKGSELTSKQRQQVLSAFVHRWTHENARQTYGGNCPACEQNKQFYRTRTARTDAEWHAYHLPLTTDAAWLADHAFYFTRDGARLLASRRQAEPAYMAETDWAPRSTGAKTV